MSSSNQTVKPTARSLPAGLLQGYDSYIGEGRSTALTAHEEGGVERHGGESSVRYRVCQGTQELMQELEINQSLTIGLFGNMFSLSQKMQFLQRQQTTSHSICIVVFAKHTEGTETATDVTLSPHVSPPKGSEELTEFHMVYGDSYVVSRTTGGEYMAAYTYHCDTVEQQLELTVEMQVGGILKGFVGDVGLQTKVNEFRSSQNMRISFDQLLTGIQQLEGGLPNPDNVIDFALQFPSLPLTAPVITQIKTRGYEHVPGIGSRFSSIARNVRLLIHPDFIDGLSRAKDVRERVQSVASVYRLYASAVGAADEKLQELKGLVEADEKAIEDMMEGFERDPSKPMHLELRSIEAVLWYGEPMMGYIGRTMALLKSVSGSSGQVSEEIDDVGEDVYGFLQQQKRITAFAFFNGSEPQHVPALSMRLRFRDGQGESWAVMHGNGNPAPPMESSGELQVPEGHTLRVIRAWSARFYIGQCSIELSDGRSLTHKGSAAIAWPRTGDNPSVRGNPAGFFFLGFQGFTMNDDTLSQLWPSQLDLVFASLTPLIWRLP